MDTKKIESMTLKITDINRINYRKAFDEAIVKIGEMFENGTYITDASVTIDYEVDVADEAKSAASEFAIWNARTVFLHLHVDQKSLAHYVYIDERTGKRYLSDHDIPMKMYDLLHFLTEYMEMLTKSCKEAIEGKWTASNIEVSAYIDLIYFKIKPMLDSIADLITNLPCTERMMEYIAEKLTNDLLKGCIDSNTYSFVIDPDTKDCITLRYRCGSVE